MGVRCVRVRCVRVGCVRVRLLHIEIILIQITGAHPSMTVLKAFALSYFCLCVHPQGSKNPVLGHVDSGSMPKHHIIGLLHSGSTSKLISCCSGVPKHHILTCMPSSSVPMDHILGCMYNGSMPKQHILACLQSGSAPNCLSAYTGTVPPSIIFLLVYIVVVPPSMIL